MDKETYFAEAHSFVREGHKVALATVIKTWGSSPRPVGAQLLIRDDGYIAGSVSGGCVETAVVQEAQSVFEIGVSKRLKYGVTSDNPFEVGIACGGQIEIWVEAIDDTGLSLSMLERLANCEERGKAIDYVIDLTSEERSIDTPKFQMSATESDVFRLALRPLQRLFIVGAVHIAQELVPIAKSIGFKTIVIDNRDFFTNKERFADCDVLLEWPAEALKNAQLDSSCAVVTLTHDDKFDIPALEVALRSEAFYVGALGSRKTQATRNQELSSRGYDVDKIHGPVGLSIGAKSPAEIAVSIMAEIIAIRHGKL